MRPTRHKLLEGAAGPKRRATVKQRSRQVLKHVDVANDAKVTPMPVVFGNGVVADNRSVKSGLGTPCSQIVAVAQAQKQTVCITKAEEGCRRSGYLHLKKSEVPIQLSHTKAEDYALAQLLAVVGNASEVIQPLRLDLRATSLEDAHDVTQSLGRNLRIVVC